MDLRGYLGVLRRNLLLLVASVVLAMGLAGFATYEMTPVYDSKARVFVSSAQADTSDAYAGGLLSEQRVDSYAILVDSRVLAQRVLDELELDSTVEELAEQVEATTIEDTVVLELSVRDEDPETAQVIAQTYAEQLVEATREIETPEGSNRPPIKASIIDPASSPDEPSYPRPVPNLGLGFLAGLVLGVVVALVRELLDNTLKTSDDLATLTAAAHMGSIVAEPAGTRDVLVTEMDAQSPRVEAFRVLRTNIQFVDVDDPHKIFIVTSAVEGEGKTSIAANLAISLARAGVRTLLVDGDLRRPRVGSLLGLDASTGVTTVLLGRVPFKEAIQRHSLSDLDVLTSGMTPPNSAELLQSRAMGALLAEARASYDVVIVDSPPLLPVTDGALLSARADGALMVVRHGSTTRDQFLTAADRLAQVDAHLVGVVLNMVPSSKSVLGYAYRSYGAKRPRGARRSRR